MANQIPLTFPKRKYLVWGEVLGANVDKTEPLVLGKDYILNRLQKYFSLIDNGATEEVERASQIVELTIIEQRANNLSRINAYQTEPLVVIQNDLNNIVQIIYNAYKVGYAKQSLESLMSLDQKFGNIFTDTITYSDTRTEDKQKKTDDKTTTSSDLEGTIDNKGTSTTESTETTQLLDVNRIPVNEIYENKAVYLSKETDENLNSTDTIDNTQTTKTGTTGNVNLDGSVSEDNTIKNQHEESRINLKVEYFPKLFDVLMDVQNGLKEFQASVFSQIFGPVENIKEQAGMPFIWEY